ncbi:MAG TPA: glutathione S-transferase [Rhodocyclaceae bacterium]|jgi:glutathione S-transferase|nr:glutathione S-transferase [Betaproteobacteria bacterium]HMV01156.1 glutathione S-transferase [Rhodocyclaceae bacterium]HMV21812.1 glutathione S-transferase [Rhodocyclaceae bacterium]HMW77964.1 glutathione S-transferase [Rhodocyclaceae bacterium]HNE43339.1 glutathione S-transferase [Rhodocyclaceae bacterium]
MKLIGSLTSPYVRKVRIVLAEKKIDYDFEIESPWTEGSKVPDLNPLGKIPVLLLDDDTPLFDSRVIVEYIDSVTPNNKLFPSPNRERIEVKRWEALADGICDAAASAFLEGKRAKKEQSAAWIQRQREKIVRGLEFMSEELGEKTYCMGTHISLADLAVGVSLGYLAFRFPDVDWHTAHPNLAKLYDKLMHRASFTDTVPRE